MTTPIHPSTAIAAAAPGWTVTTGSPKTGEEITVPIAAWVLAPTAAGQLGDSDLVQPAFVIDGGVWTTAEYTEVFSYAVHVNPPATP